MVEFQKRLNGLWYPTPFIGAADHPSRPRVWEIWPCYTYPRALLTFKLDLVYCITFHWIFRLELNVFLMVPVLSSKDWSPVFPPFFDPICVLSEYWWIDHKEYCPLMDCPCFVTLKKSKLPFPKDMSAPYWFETVCSLTMGYYHWREKYISPTSCHLFYYCCWNVTWKYRYPTLRLRTTYIYTLPLRSIHWRSYDCTWDTHGKPVDRNLIEPR